MQLDGATSKETLDEIIDYPAAVPLINSCGWPPTKVITLSSKNELIHCLVHHEVIQRRSPAISAFREGLSVLGLCSAFKESTRALRPLLVYTPVALTANQIKGMVEWEEGSLTEEQKRSQVFFNQYLEQKESSKEGM